ncbi:UBX domain-containing protein 2 [Spathaspora sp. JA1]|nr:UBX domain-containing protein 2 [Spathaspora sp. JA1]
MSTDLSPEQQEAITQFKSIVGIEDNEQDDKVERLLVLHEYNLNNAISTYFDSGFEMAESHSSGVQTHQEDDQFLHHRQHTPPIPPPPAAPARDNIVNLQHQMFMDNLIPRFPKAPTISNGWQLEVGIHTSLIHEREEQQKKEEENEDDRETTISVASTEIEEEETRKPSPAAALWVLLLIIPKTIWNILVSAVRFLFGFGTSGVSSGNINKIPRTFNFDKFHPNYKVLDQVSSWLTKKELIEDEVQKSDTSIVTNFNIFESDFNQVHRTCQSEYHWLLVVLVNDSLESQRFVRELFTNSGFDSLFNKNTGTFKETQIFISNMERNREGFEVAHTYRVRRVPYIMLIGNVSSSPDVMASMSILYKSNLSSPFVSNDYETRLTVIKIIKNVNKFLDKFTPQLISARYDKQEMEFSRMIRQQQDDAYLQSLEQDRLKKVQREREEKLKNDLEISFKRQQYYLLNLLKHDFFLTVTTTSEDRFRIAVKLPSGKRLVEFFNKAITINEFYMFIELKLFVEELLESQGAEFEEIIKIIDELIDDVGLPEALQEHPLTIKDYCETYPFKFEIIQPYPKKVIVASDVSISEAPDFKGANFLVEFTNEDEDDTGEDEE